MTVNERLSRLEQQHKGNSEVSDFMHQRTERLSNETTALLLLVTALVKSHPHPDRLIQSIETGLEIFLAVGTPKAVSDDMLSYVRKAAAQAISYARSPTRAG